MTDLRGLCTNRNGTVTVIIPADECIDHLMHGGGISCEFTWRFGFRKWMHDKASMADIALWWARNAIPKHLAIDWEVEKFVRDYDWRPDRQDRGRLARRWIEALDRGGLSEHEAVSLIVEKDAPNWSLAHEIVHKDAIPKDRRYRNAWRRSANGGPIWIDEAVAQRLEENQMWDHYHANPA